jgi:hypothetical protein
MNKLIISYAISSLILFKLFVCFEHCLNLSVKYEDESLKEFDAFSNYSQVQREDLKELRKKDDISATVEFIFRFKFFDKYYPYLIISSNGYCSFDFTSLLLTNSKPVRFPIKDRTKSIITPFWSDIDNRGLGGDIYYHQTTNALELRKIACDIQKSFKTFSNYKPLFALIVTWYKVRSFEARTKDITNTFQLVLTTNGFYSFAIYNYGNMNWPQPSFEQPFQAGFNLGDGIIYNSMPQSFTHNVSSLHTDSNVGIPSKWIFRVDSNEKEINNFIKFGTIMNDNLLDRSDESYAGPITINTLAITNKLKLSSLFIYANGFITFNKPFEYKYSSVPKSMPLNGTSMIFPFWSDINTMNTGDIFYREINDTESLNEISKQISSSSSSSANFNQAIWAFQVTWFQVYPHTLMYDTSNNTFQIVLASNGSGAVYTILNYGDIMWPNKNIKQPVESGYSLDIDHYYLISQTNLTNNSNVNFNGRYVFRLDKEIRYAEANSLVADNKGNYKILIFNS